ncbi:MAG: glycine betaine ABC transporter substrate-binding protein [Streptosporangiales bacterium]
MTTHTARRTHGRALVALVTVLTLAAVASGCGLKAASQFVPAAGPGSIKPTDSLEGVDVSVGSKDFTEQLILGKITVIALTVAGANVTDQTNIQGSNSARRALERNSINMYWEYTGTSWISYNQQTKPIASKKKMWQAVKKADAKQGIVWLPPADLNDTYAMAIRDEAAKKLDVQTLSDMAKLPPKELTFCVESEFASRNDGLVGMLKHYGIPLGKKVPRDQVKTMGTGVVYTQTDKGTCNFGEVFTTDGRIKALGLTVLKDDKHFFPSYNVALNVNEQWYKQHSQITKTIAPIRRKLTNQMMVNLTEKVDVEGQDPALVARDWMVKEGFITK